MWAKTHKSTPELHDLWLSIVIWAAKKDYTKQRNMHSTISPNHFSLPKIQKNYEKNTRKHRPQNVQNCNEDTTFRYKRNSIRYVFKCKKLYLGNKCKVYIYYIRSSMNCFCSSLVAMFFFFALSFIQFEANPLFSKRIKTIDETVS